MLLDTYLLLLEKFPDVVPFVNLQYFWCYWGGISRCCPCWSWSFVETMLSILQSHLKRIHKKNGMKSWDIHTFFPFYPLYFSLTQKKRKEKHFPFPLYTQWTFTSLASASLILKKVNWQNHKMPRFLLFHGILRKIEVLEFVTSHGSVDYTPHLKEEL